MSKGDSLRWRVRASDSSGNSPWSGWSTFTFAPGATGSTTRAVVEVTHNLTVPAGGAFTLDTVLCPEGTIIAGGGWYRGGGSPIDYLYVESSSQWGNGWSVGFRNPHAADQPAVSYAECLRGVSGNAVQSYGSSTEVQPSQLGAQTVDCTQGVRSGGGFYAPSVDLNFFKSLPQAGSSKAWRVHVRNEGNSPQSFQATATCLVGTGASVSVVTSAATSVPAATTGTALVTCPAGSLALSGGFSAAARISVLSSQGNGNGWKAYAINPTTQRPCRCEPSRFARSSHDWPPGSREIMTATRPAASASRRAASRVGPPPERGAS